MGIIKLFKKYRWVIIFILTLAIYLPSIFVFYTNDDFFFLKISNVNSLFPFLNFFNPLKGPDGLGMYRPLTTQVFYFLGLKLFNGNPVFLHLIAFMALFAIIYLVYKLSVALTANKNIGFIASLLYATSATHFAHLYYLATFQELGMTFFVLLSLISFLNGKIFKSLLFFILGLLSKETAIVTPVLIGLMYIYKNGFNFPKVEIKKLAYILTPFAICSFTYLFIHFRWYGVATGDTYVWDFNLKKFVNSITWYIVWSLNLPETLLDFISPGPRINIDLFKHWGPQFKSIFALFFVELLFLAYLLINVISNKSKEIIAEVNKVSTFCIIWFLVTIIPVVFLPQHKFTFYLTLPLVAVVLRIAYLFEQKNISAYLKIIFVAAWVSLSFLTVKHSVSTHWITQGEKISLRVYKYFNENADYLKNKNIVFFDTFQDADLPWSPTQLLKTVLSDKNFFHVYLPDLSGTISYGESVGEKINSRQFLGY